MPDARLSEEQLSLKKTAQEFTCEVVAPVPYEHERAKSFPRAVIAQFGTCRRGYAKFLSMLDEGRIAIADVATGVAQGCVDETVKYAKQGEAFGKPTGQDQIIEFKTARMEARAHTACTAYYDAAAKMVAGLPLTSKASIAKIGSREAGLDNARDANDVHDGYGFIDEYVVSRHCQDSKILEVEEGTPEVQLMLIARELGL